MRRMLGSHNVCTSSRDWHVLSSEMERASIAYLACPGHTDEEDRQRFLSLHGTYIPVPQCQSCLL